MSEADRKMLRELEMLLERVESFSGKFEYEEGYFGLRCSGLKVSTLRMVVKVRTMTTCITCRTIYAVVDRFRVSDLTGMGRGILCPK